MGMFFSSPRGDSEAPKESLSHSLVFWSSLVGAVLQAGLCDPSGRWLTRAGSCSLPIEGDSVPKSWTTVGNPATTLPLTCAVGLAGCDPQASW